MAIMDHIFVGESADNEVVEAPLDEVSVEELASVQESIAVGVRDAEALMKATEALRNARLSGKTGSELTQCIEMHRIVRTRLAHRYGVDVTIVPAVESADGRTLVMVAEEEENEGDGFFKKLIDSIINAFKWLWEKVTSVFSSGKKDEADKKAIEKSNDSLSKLKDDKSKAPKAGEKMAVLKAWCGTFPPGSNPKFDLFIEYIKTNEASMKKLCDAVPIVEKYVNESKTLLENLGESETKEGVTSKTKELVTRMIGDLSSLFVGKFDASKHSWVVGEGQAGGIDPTVSIAVEELATSNRGLLVIALSSKKGGLVSKYSHYKQEKGENKLLAPASESEIDEFIKVSETTMKAYDEAIADRKSKIESIKSICKETESRLETLKKEKKSPAVTSGLAYIQSLGGLVLLIQNLLTATPSIAGDIDAVAKVLLSGKSDEKKDGQKEEPSKDEAGKDEKK